MTRDRTSLGKQPLVERRALFAPPKNETVPCIRPVQINSTALRRVVSDTSQYSAVVLIWRSTCGVLGLGGKRRYRCGSLNSRSGALNYAVAKAAAFFLFLLQPSRPKTPRPVAKSGRAAGSGVADAISKGTPTLSDSVYAIAGPEGGEI